jgi:hypothetical protein
MNLKTLIKLVTLPTLFLITLNLYGQKVPNIKYFHEETVDEVRIDYDGDGDLDYIVAGVNPERLQGRVYLIENKGNKFGKPEYLYSFPSVPLKQKLVISQENSITKIDVKGTSPAGKQVSYIGTLVRGNFEGVTVPPVTASIK